MDSVFRSVREKLEREHRERKEIGKLELEREKKANDAARRQREAVAASLRATNLEAKMKVEDELGEEKKDGGDSSTQALPQWMISQEMKLRQDANVDCGSDKDSKLLTYYKALMKLIEVAEDGSSVLTGNENFKRLTLNVGAEEEEEDEEDVCWEED